MNRIDQLLAQLDHDELEALKFDWSIWARRSQLPPNGDWTTWLLLGGRGAGKTRAGAEWVRASAMAQKPKSPIALVGETLADARAVMVEGHSGLMSIHPTSERPSFHRARNELEWPNGAIARLYSAADPESLRGPQFASAWCDEIGCGAVGNGANQPNAFSDPKSAENKSPYNSDGQNEPAIQRQFLRAHYDHWQADRVGFDENDNPLSAIDGRRMLDPDRFYVWAWDARPFPAFPLREDVWSDGISYHTGHWTTGRFGCATVGEMAVSIAGDIGVDLHAIDSASAFVEGCVVGTPSSVRNDIELLLEADQLTLNDSAQGLALSRVQDHLVTSITPDSCALNQNGLFERSHLDIGDRLRRFNVNYRDRLADYDVSSAFHTTTNQAGSVSGTNLPLTIDRRMAMRIARNQVDRSAEDVKTIKFALPPSQLHFEVGDVVAVPNDPEKYVIAKIVDGNLREITAVRLGKKNLDGTANAQSRPVPPITLPPASDPIVYIARVPPLDDEEIRSSIVIGGYARPWPGRISVIDEYSSEIVRLCAPTTIGTLKSSFPKTDRFANWDTKNTLIVELIAGHLSSASKARVFAGENRLLVQNVDGHWEEVGYEKANLIDDKTYALSNLLRGLNKTEFAAAVSAEAGARVISLSDASYMSLDAEPSAFKAIAGADDQGASIPYAGFGDHPNLPLAPTHLRAEKQPNGDILISWRRRSRRAGNRWPPVDVPMDGSTEQYTINVSNSGTAVRSVSINANQFNYALSDQVSDFGTPPDQFEFSVTQDSAMLGHGHVATGDFN